MNEESLHFLLALPVFFFSELLVVSFVHFFFYWMVCLFLIYWYMKDK